MNVAEKQDNSENQPSRSHKKVCGKLGCDNESTGRVWGDLIYETCDEHRAEIERLVDSE